MAQTLSTQASDGQLEGPTGSAWTNLANVEAEDDSGASSVIPDGGQAKELRLRDFGFSADIPSSAYILGLSVLIRAKFTSSGFSVASLNSFQFAIISALNTVTLLGNSLAPAQVLETSFTDYSYGSACGVPPSTSPTLFGIDRAGLASVIRGENFGVVLNFINSAAGSSTTVYVDYVSITVCYHDTYPTFTHFGFGMSFPGSRPS